MLTIYRLSLYLALPWLLLRLILRGLREPRYLQGIPQRFGYRLPPTPAGGIWIHAVSVGEVGAATPLLRYLLRSHPHLAITVTTMTPTGAERVRKTFGAEVTHCYLPYDYPGAVRRFISALRPRLALVMETEIWPNLIHHCARRGVPMLYLNVRLSRRSLRGYHRFRRALTPALATVQHFAAQSRADARRLRHLGAPPAAISITGSIKFDVELPASVLEAAQAVRRELGQARAVWVAGSTHDGEEEPLLSAFASLRQEFPSLLLVLVPRHPQRFAAVARLAARHGQTALRSRGTQVAADTDIYIADTMGELQLLLAAADLAFIGGSLVPTGGHNVLEACAAGVPVVFGPHMFNFAEIAELAIREKAAIQVQNPTELTTATRHLLGDPLLRDQYGRHGQELVAKNRGALAKICALVDAELAV